MTKSRRGSALIELALSVTLLGALLVGAFQFGYVYTAYDRMQSAVRTGARFASELPYQSRTGGCLEAQRKRIAGLVVYGTPAPTPGAVPIAAGLDPSKVEVAWSVDAKGVPSSVTVAIRGFKMESGFQSFTFDGKPSATLPYFGRYAPNECEP